VRKAARADAHTHAVAPPRIPVRPGPHPSAETHSHSAPTHPPPPAAPRRPPPACFSLALPPTAPSPRKPPWPAAARRPALFLPGCRYRCCRRRDWLPLVRRRLQTRTRRSSAASVVVISLFLSLRPQRRCAHWDLQGSSLACRLCAHSGGASSYRATTWSSLSRCSTSITLPSSPTTNPRRRASSSTPQSSGWPRVAQEGGGGRHAREGGWRGGRGCGGGAGASLFCWVWPTRPPSQPARGGDVVA